MTNFIKTTDFTGMDFDTVLATLKANHIDILKALAPYTDNDGDYILGYIITTDNNENTATFDFDDNGIYWDVDIATDYETTMGWDL
jgi:hypothetical protein